MKQDRESVIYMLDTNILIEWASTFTPDLDNADKNRKKSKMRIKAFCEKNENRIVVPDLVWVEFLSVILHKDINVEEDYKSCLLKFRNKQSLVQQIEGHIRSASNWILDWEPDTSPFADAQELLQDPNLINLQTFAWMKRSAENRQKYRPTNNLTAKLLDGMDSAILICLNELASEQENQNTQVVLYTGDLPLCRILERLKQVHKKWFARNTSAVFSFPEQVMCKHRMAGKRKWCGHMNDASILRKKNMICQSSSGKKRHLMKL